LFIFIFETLESFLEVVDTTEAFFVATFILHNLLEECTKDLMSSQIRLFFLQC